MTPGAEPQAGPSMLSMHFSERELRVEEAEDRVKANARFLCQQILEPLRRKFGPLEITSGWRDEDRNANAGGKAASFHLYIGDKCAADLKGLQAGPIALFDWLRHVGILPFDKVILEYKDGAPDIVHIQAFVDAMNRRKRRAFIGKTGAATKYTEVECL